MSSAQYTTNRISLKSRELQNLKQLYCCYGWPSVKEGNTRFFKKKSQILPVDGDQVENVGASMEKMYQECVSVNVMKICKYLSITER